MDIEELPELIGEESVLCATNGDDTSDNDDDNFSDVEEEMEIETVQCLFCKLQLTCVKTGMVHLKQTHNVDFSRLKSKFHMDQYSFLKLINCVRWDDVPAEKIIAASEPFWNDEKYLKPKEYEAWLCYDYDELPAAAIEKVGIVNEDLALTVHNLREQIKEQSLLLVQAREDMAKMRANFKRLLEKETPLLDGIPAGERKSQHSTTAVSQEADNGYFKSYAHFGIHHEMLLDAVRTNCYRDALLLNTELLAGKDVLDVGCGTAVLSIFASQAGAKNIIGIDNSDIIYNAMDIVKRNNINNVSLVKGRLEDTTLPQPKFDIIISEWMGYFLLFEGMLDTVIYARDIHLKENGTLLPNRCTMSIIGYGSDALYQHQVTFWNDVYGIDMSNMRKDVLHEPLIDVVEAEHILTEPNIIADFNLQNVDLNYSNFSYKFNLKCIKDGEISAFVGYFDTYFDLPVSIMFSTSPNSKPTHWKQVVFFLEQPQKIKAGDVVIGKIVCRRSRNSTRSLDITIEAFGKKCSYYLD